MLFLRDGILLDGSRWVYRGRSFYTFRGGLTGHLHYKVPQMIAAFPHLYMHLRLLRLLRLPCLPDSLSVFLFLSNSPSVPFRSILNPLSLVVTLISLLYASLLHQIQTYDRRLAYSLHSSHSSATSRRESMMPTSEASRRVSLIPPNPTGYSVETGGTKVGAGVVKLGLGRRWERAGMYALSVAISFWVSENS